MTLFGKKRTQVEETLNGIIQRDEYLDIIKRMGIPTAASDSLDADGISQFKIIYNTTLGKLRIHNGVSWVDAVPADLSNYYTKTEIDLLFNTVNTNIAILQGLYLEANQTTSEIYLKDGDNNILSTLNVGFLNNEGTTFSYNAIDNTLNLYNEQNELLSSIPVSSFVSNLAANLIFNGTTPYTLELKDNEGTVVSSVNITINNIQGLQAALDSKEPKITILPVTKGGTGNNSITENSFFIGGPANTMVEKTPQEIINLILSVGNGLDFTDNILKVASVSSARIVVNPTGIDLAQTAVSAGTWTKVTVDNYGRVISATNATLADFSTIVQSIHDLSTDGIIVKNGTGTVTRTITGTSGRISVTNGDGVSGNPTIDLVPTSVIPGTYNSVTVDDYGRVTVGTTINILSTVLSGFSLLVGGPVIDTDTIISAFGKIQNQINDLTSGKLDKVTTVDVEKVYIKKADGTQDVKATSEFKEVIEGYFNGTNFYTDSGFTNLITPESGKIYLNIVVKPTTQYRWSGSAYVLIGGNNDYFTLGSPVITVSDIVNFTRLTNFTSTVSFSQDTGTSDHSLLSTKFTSHNIFGRVPYDCVLESLTINNQFGGPSSWFEISIWVADAVTGANKVEVAHISYVPNDMRDLFTIPASIVIPKGSQIQVFIKRPPGGGVAWNRGFWLFFKRV